MSCPEIISRGAWGAKDANSANNSSNPPLPIAVITHTFCDDFRFGRTCDSFASCAEEVRELQKYNMQVYSDIIYHFLIGGNGMIFKGRDWLHYGNFERKFNQIAYGIAFIGNFNITSNTMPTQAALQSANALIGCAVSQNYLMKNYTLANIGINPRVMAFLNLAPVEVVFPAALVATTCTVLTVMLLVIGIISMVVRRRNKQKIAHYSQRYYDKNLRKLLPPALLSYYEIFRVAVKLTGILLGRGQSGIVLKGHYTNRSRPNEPEEVAVKILRTNWRSEAPVKNFIMEMEILMKAGRHANIVSLIGVVLQGELMIVMEYCSMGSLDKVLRSCKIKSEDPLVFRTDCLADQRYVRLNAAAVPTVDLLLIDFSQFAYEISRGMEFLNSRQIIHRDLAARNILLDSHKIIKIADFGMARHQQEYVLDRENVLLPLRWMAPESISGRKGSYTVKSDIWSFGVVLWELFSLGKVPYADPFLKGCTDQQLVHFLQQGHRLEKPTICPEEIFVIMQRCWKWNSHDRPDFQQIKTELANFVPSLAQDLYIALDDKNLLFNSELAKRLAMNS